MAIYDSELRKVVVRVVYDGPAYAGKTTNLVMLERFFTTQRRGELVSPRTMEGRTLYFDWMHIDGGLVAGHGLRCQLLTVPGQKELSLRRANILAHADVLVFVAEAAADGLERAREMFETVRTDVPIVLQVNKTDLPDALEPEAVRERIGMPGDTPALGASAREGVGVRETLVLAIRAAASRVQKAVLEGGIEQLEGSAQTHDELLEELRTLERDAHVLLIPKPIAHPDSEAPPPGDSIFPVLVESNPPPEAPSGSWVATPAMPPPPAPPESEPPRSLWRDADTEVSPRAADGDDPELIVEHDPTVEDELNDALDGEENEPFETERPAAAASAFGVASRTAGRPPFPTPEVPPGFIWPAASGRDVLHSLRRLGEPEPVAGVRGRHGLAAGSGGHEVVLFRAGDWCLKTSERRRFDDPDDARAALLRLARAKGHLGDLLAPDTVLTVQPGPDETYWLWTVSIWLHPARSIMADAIRDGDDLGLSRALVDFGRAALDSATLALRRGTVLDIHPSNYGLREDGRCFYIDDDIERGTRIPALGHALLHRVVEYDAHRVAIARYIAFIESELPRRFDHAAADALGLFASLEAEPARTELAGEARARWQRALAARRAAGG